MKQPLISKAARGLMKSRSAEIPAPVLGWNTRDPITSLRPQEAVILENFFPDNGRVKLRNGAENWATGLVGGRVLLPYRGGLVKKLFAATNTGIFDVTASGAAGASVAAITSGDLSYSQITVAGGTFLVAANGVDPVIHYNGTTWANPSITGVSSSSLNGVCMAVQRLWFTQNDSSSVWYLPVASISGAATEFSLGRQFLRGGSCVAIGVWTVDGGTGVDDYTVFASSEGEVVVYKGTDPSNASTWAKVGTYYIGKPLSKRCFCKFGGDLLYLADTGVFPLAKAVQSVDINESTALSDKIAPSLNAAAKAYSQFFGWSAVLHTGANALLVNCPLGANYSCQFVMNTVTGAWCLFTGWYAYDFVVFEKSLYAILDNRVAKVWSGNKDFGGSITAAGMGAYSGLNAPNVLKHPKLVTPLLRSSGNVSFSFGFDPDYSISDNPLQTANPSAQTGSLWDTGTWDNALWGGSPYAMQNTLSVACVPFVKGAFRIGLTASDVEFEWLSAKVVYQTGGIF